MIMIEFLGFSQHLYSEVWRKIAIPLGERGLTKITVQFTAGYTMSSPTLTETRLLRISGSKSEVTKATVVIQGIFPGITVCEVIANFEPGE